MHHQHTIDVSSEDDDEVPTDPLEVVFLGKGTGLSPKTGILTGGGDNFFCILAISEGLKLCKLESEEYCMFGGVGKWPKFGFLELMELSSEIFFVVFN